MNKIFFVISLSLIVFSIKLNAQTNAGNDAKLSGDELANYEKQAKQLVSFMEFAFNTLGSNQSEYKDKHTIIEQSYLKFFKNDKVQIEDDLVEKRDMVTNKNVQAYLKDIDFFFKTATFKYTIEEITQEINEVGEVYFKIKASRNLKGTNIENKQINDNRTRYIEINLDKANRELKIVSVYTTKSNEEQELITWWNSLTDGWRYFLSGNTTVYDSILLRNITSINKDKIVKRSIYPGANDTLTMYDSVKVNPNALLTEIRRILRADEMVLTDVPGIYDLKPLYAFSMLKHLDITKARVPDLEPIRNLSKLETLIASRSLIISLEPLRYIPSMRVLDVSGTLVNSISQIESFENLEVLNISDSRVDTIKVLKNLPKLRELNISGIQINDLTPLSQLTSLEILEISRLPISTLKEISGLTNLKRLVFDRTEVQDLNDLKNLEQLEFVLFDNTDIDKLAPLEDIAQLKLVYCDKTHIDKAEALAFMQKRPDVKVIYESQELMAWWQTLPGFWKSKFSSLVALSPDPTREELHEVSFIKTLDLSGNKDLTSIEPLSKLSALTILNISNTNVSDLKPIENIFSIQVLNVSRSKVSELNSISGLSSLREIDFARTGVSSIEPLTRLLQLRSINMDSTTISDPELISSLRRLEVILADGVASISPFIHTIWDSIPDVLIVNKTAMLSDWWVQLPDHWKEYFMNFEAIDQSLDRVKLHKIASLKELDLTKVRGISTIRPLSVMARTEKLVMSNLQISDLSPLSSLSRILILDISNTPVNSLASIKSNQNLVELNCANSQVSDMQPLSGLRNLTKLNISGTQVSKLDALESCTALQELTAFNTRINNLKPIENLRNLKILRVYNTRISDRRIDKFKEKRPDVEVIFY